MVPVYLAIIALCLPVGAGVWNSQESLDTSAVFHTGDRAGQDFIVSIEKAGGTLWVGSQGHLSHVGDTDTLVLASLPDSVECAVEGGQAIASRRISHFSMYPARFDSYEGSLWVGINDCTPCCHADYLSAGSDGTHWLKPGGILLFEPTVGRWRFYPPTKGKVSSRTYSVAFDSSSVWIWGQYPSVEWETEGVYRHDRGSGAISFIASDFGYNHGIAALECHVPTDLLAVLHDDLWFGQAKLDGRAETWTSYSGATGRANRDVSVVKSDGRKLWFGYNSGVVICYNPESGKFEPQVLPASRGAVTCFAFSDSCTLAGVGWIEWDRKQKTLCSGGGILARDRSAADWKFVESIPGLPSAAVTGLRLDNDTLWVGTNKGLVRWSLSALLLRSRM